MSKYERGLLTICDPGADKALSETATFQCVHCGGHQQMTPGSGKLRGFCYRCNGLICGPGCAECIPEDFLLESYEKGRDPDTKPPERVSVVWTPPNYGE